ncbi:MAG TPA: hypothetical protein VFZ73_03285 [Gemmatimonadaceae bacterium]
MTPDETMQHLPIERLAELADGEPTADERDHLAECAMCSAERIAYHRVVAMAADERRRIAPPISTWGMLSEELREQGLITTREQATARTLFIARVRTVAIRAAAGFAILVTGLVGGRLTAGLPLRSALALGGGDVPVSTLAVNAEEFASTAAAMQVLQRAQQEYERAAMYLASHDTSTTEASTEAYRTTLAALDEMAETSLRALSEAPADPIINQVYFTTLGARNMTLGKLATALPTGSRLSRF